MKEHSKRKHRITTKEDAPEWLVRNRYLLSGYRTDFHTFKSSLRSLFMFHNETLNVWTHLIGSILFIIVLSYLFINFQKSKYFFNELKTEISNTPFAKKLSDNTSNILPFFNERREGIQNSEDFTKHLEDLKQAHTDYLQDLWKFFQNKELKFIRRFNEGYHSFSNVVYEALDDILRTNKVKELNKILKLYFTEEALRDFLLHSVEGRLEFYPIIVFVGCTILCLGFSATYHLFNAVSPKVAKLLHKLDFAGISFLNFGSSYAVFFYYFYCNPYLLYIFNTIIFVACLACFTASMTEWMDKKESRTFRGIMYGALGISNVLPSLVILYLSTISKPENHLLPIDRSFFGILLMATFYLTGLVFYVSRMPERFFPRRFDIWLNSHTIWHIFVFAAACQHLLTLSWVYKLRSQYICKIY